jgi:hypothetical protein
LSFLERLKEDEEEDEGEEETEEGVRRELT